MAIPFRQCAFSIDLLTHSGEFSGVVSFTGQSVFYRRDKTFRVGAMADLPCKTSLAGAFKAMFARMADTGMPWRYAVSLLMIGRQKFFGAQPRTEKTYPNGFDVEWNSWSLPQPITAATGFWRSLSGRRHPSAH